LNRALRSRNEHDGSFSRMCGDDRIVELVVMKRNCDGVEAKRRCAIDERDCGVRNPIDRVFGGVDVKVYFEHICYQNEAPNRAIGVPFRSIATSVPLPAGLPASALAAAPAVTAAAATAAPAAIPAAAEAAGPLRPRARLVD